MNKGICQPHTDKILCIRTDFIVEMLNLLSTINMKYFFDFSVAGLN